MKIHLPNSAFLGNIDTFVQSFMPENKEVLEVTFNKKWLSLHPLVLSMTTALALQVQKNNGKIITEKLEATSKHYLERMGLLRFLNMPAMHVQKHEPAGRFIPITQITDSEELTRFITDMIPLLHADPEQAEPIKYVISELVRNVFEHAETDLGAIVCAQFFKKSNRVSIGVVDVGIGIRKTIQKSHRPKDDISAIKLALTPGVTGATRKYGGTETNAGAGLFFIKSIAEVNRDFFLIYSGNATYKLLKTPSSRGIRLRANPEDDKHSVNTDMPYWHGTAVGIDISPDRHQTFDQLLDLIRNVYRLDMRDRKKERFKRARFI